MTSWPRFSPWPPSFREFLFPLFGGVSGKGERVGSEQADTANVFFWSSIRSPPEGRGQKTPAHLRIPPFPHCPPDPALRTSPGSRSPKKAEGTRKAQRRSFLGSIPDLNKAQGGHFRVNSGFKSGFRIGGVIFGIPSGRIYGCPWLKRIHRMIAHASCS